MYRQPVWIPKAGQRIRFVERNGRITNGIIQEAENGLLALQLDDGRDIRTNTYDKRLKPVGTKGLSSPSKPKSLPTSGTEIRGFEIMD